MGKIKNYEYYKKWAAENKDKIKAYKQKYEEKRKATRRELREKLNNEKYF